LASAILLFLLVPRLGTEFFPRVDTGAFRIRLRAPIGTRVERTEVLTLRALEVIRQEVGPDNVNISTAYVGTIPPSYPVLLIYLFTSGQHEAVLQVALKATAPFKGEALQERLREKLSQALPNTSISFEAGDIISQVMSFGSPTPIQVDVQGPDLAANRAFAQRVRDEMAKVADLRDLQY